MAEGSGCQLLQSTQTPLPQRMVDMQLLLDRIDELSRLGLFDVNAQLLLEGCNGMTFILKIADAKQLCT